MTIPLLWPHAGAPGLALATSLHDVYNTAMNVPMPTDDPVEAYVHWATASVASLRPWLSADDVDSLIRTPAYWSALSMPFGTGKGARLVNDEMTARRQQLERVIASIEEFNRRFHDVTPSTVVVPDTNVLLEHPQQLADTDWHQVLTEHVRPLDNVRLVIPLLVIDELDNAKRVKRTEQRARAVLKTIYERFSPNIDALTVVRRQTEDRGNVSLEVLMEAPTHSRLPRPDDELVRVASQLSSFVPRPVVFTSYDTGAALRAAAAGLAHIRLQH
jgi:rRNA-processing protein FCF1